MKQFRFRVFTQIEGKPPGFFLPVEVVKVADSFEAALDMLTVTHPNHHVAKHLTFLWREESVE